MTSSRALDLIVAALRQEPFLVLGPRMIAGTLYVRAYLPHAHHVELLDRSGARLPMQPFGDSGLFEWRGHRDRIPAHPLLTWIDADGRRHLRRDAYSFATAAPETADPLDASRMDIDGIVGTRFVARMPQAHAVSLRGDFNGGCPRSHPMARAAVPGVWWLFVPGVTTDCRHRFHIERCLTLDEDQAPRRRSTQDCARQYGDWFMATTRKRTRKPSSMSAEERRAQIAQAAYLRAQQRQFAPGHELEDWLAAEREIDAATTTSKRR
jgi:Protein of unknown function (DUF2934)/alpha-1,4-glucan branching enzyme GlgB, N-terminal domain/Carbohydrate-binding module 48 (Isoamylase N-terminal domain)